jgi:hypothetical protein
MLAVAVAVCAPWLVPASLPFLRLFGGLVGWLAITKAAELARDLPRDYQTRVSTGAFLLWLVMPRPTTWPTDATERARFRAEGVSRGLRGSLKVACLLVLIAVSVSWPDLHTRLWLHSFWGLWVCYLAFSGGMDLATSIPMLFGVHVAENFDRPYLAASPRELWSQRWNFWFHDFVLREVFLPLRRSPRRAVLATFAVSGLAHEYLIIAALGRSRGQMWAFFILQALGVLLFHRRARSVPRGLAWTLHFAWLVLTIPLFLEPILEIVPLHKLGARDRTQQPPSCCAQTILLHLDIGAVAPYLAPFRGAQVLPDQRVATSSCSQARRISDALRTRRSRSSVCSVRPLRRGDRTRPSVARTDGQEARPTTCSSAACRSVARPGCAPRAEP